MSKRIIGTYHGIKCEFTPMIDEYTVEIRESSNRVVVKTQKFDSIVNEQFDTLTEAEARADELLAEKPTRNGYTEVRAWFIDGGTRYAARYPGQDVLGRRFEAGTEILRKKKQNLIV